jgi:hypothetical protein
MRQAKIKNTVMEPFITPHSSALTGANIMARYIETTGQVVIVLEAKTVWIEKVFMWDGVQSDFTNLMTQNMSELVADYQRELAHQAYCDTILQKRA